MTFWDLDEFDRRAEEGYARLMGDDLPPGERQRIHREAAKSAHVMYVSAEDYDAMMKRLDEPPRVLPGLRRLMEQAREG
jgi:hypothetical protein